MGEKMHCQYKKKREKKDFVTSNADRLLMLLTHSQ